MTAVSVVIPLYNKELYITRALNSVITQTFKDFEIIVVDDGSTDNGAEIVREFNDPRIRLIQQENKGVSVARNQGIEAAEGELVAFLDADDEWVPSFLEKILCLYKKYPDAGMFVLAYILFNQKNKIITSKYLTIPNHPWCGVLPNYFKSASLDWGFVSSSSICIPRYILIETGLFKKDVLWGEDQDLWGRIALKYPIVYCTQIGSVTHLVESDINRLNKRIVYQKIHPFILEANEILSKNLVPNSILEDFKEYIAFLQIQTISHNLDIGDRIFAKNILKECKTNRFKNEKLWCFFWSFIPFKLYGNKIIKKFRELTIFILKSCLYRKGQT